MTRAQFIERVRRQIYNGQPSDDATITVGLVNNYLNDAIAAAAKANYKDNIAIDGIGYLNNSFYTRFTGIAVKSDGNLWWKVQLPEIPIGIGRNEGLSTIQLVNDEGKLSHPFIPISESQRTYFESMRPIPNKIIYYYQGDTLYAQSSLILSQYTANVTMASGGLSTDLDSTLNVPADYIPVMMQYLQQQLLLEKSQPKDVTNDGEDFVQTT